MEKRAKYLFLNTRDEFYRVDISKIVWLEAAANYTTFCLCNGEKGEFLASLGKMQDILSETLREDARGFARVGKSHIVNLRYVYHISPLRGELTLSDGATFSYKLSVGKEALKGLKKVFVDMATKKQ